MRVVILAVGSRGDVQPCLALGLGLRDAGYSVALATHREVEGFVAGHGLDFKALEGNPRALLQSEEGLAWSPRAARPGW